MVTAGANNMSADKLNKIDSEINRIHTHIKKSNIVLRQRIKEIQQEMTEWDVLGGIDDGKSNGSGFMSKD